MANQRGVLFRRSVSMIPSLEDKEEAGDDTESVSSDESTIFSQTAFTFAKGKSQFRKRTASETEEDVTSRQKSPTEWSIIDVKQWVRETFESEEIAEKFESEEVDGAILMSQAITTTEAMEKLGLTTIGKKGKFLEKLKQLSGDVYGYEEKAVVVKKPRVPSDFADMDRVLTNKEKDGLICSDRGVYNTKKKRILAHVKKVWPEDQPTPWFRNNAESTKNLTELVDRLSQDDSCVFPKAGLGRNAIEAVIRKKMQERRRKEKDPIRSESDTVTSDSSSSSPESHEKRNNYAAYFNKELSAMSALAIVLEWLEKETASDLRMQDLRKESKSLGLSLLRNKDKNTHINAIASTLLKEGTVVVAVPLHRVSRQDVTICKP